MSASEIISLILSVVTIIVAVIALFQSNKQIKVSNKQCLFEKRTQKYIKLRSLVEIYEGNRKLLEYSDKIPEFLFQMLTKGNLFNEDNFINAKPLSQEEQNKFLDELDNYRTIALEISILWDSEESQLASNFINAYVDLLMKLFRQHIASRSKEVRNGYNEVVVQMLAKDIKLAEGIKLIEAIYNELKNKDVLNILKEQLTLK